MGAVRGDEFETSDPDEFVQRLKPVAPPFDLCPTQPSFSAKVRTAPIEGLGLFIARVDHGDVVVKPLRETFSINVPLAAGIEGRRGLGFDAIEPGSVAIGVPGEPLDLRFRVASPLLVANFSAALLQETLSAFRDEMPEFPTLPPWSADAVRVFRTLSACWRDALSEKDSERFEEQRDAVVEDVATALVASASRGTTAERTSWDAKRIVAIGLDFIHDELARPLTIADIARAARTSPRTLHRAFMEQIGVSPMAYVRRERLHALRRFLLQADPRQTKVSDVARMYGLRHLGRLSTLYRDAFGESPSETLVR